MEKFYVIDTWNGQGYSDSDLLATFGDKMSATKYAFEQAVKMYISKSGTELEVHNHLNDDEDSFISVTEKDTNKEDSGVIHVLKGDSETHGVLIRPDTCSADLLTYTDQVAWIDDIIKDAESKESEKEFRDSMMYGTIGDCHTNSFGFCKIIKLF